MKFHYSKHNFFFIKAGIIPMRMSFRGKEDVPTEIIQIPVDEVWYQDLKDVPLISLPERALVGASMSLNWKMDREDKPVYMEDGKVVLLYVVAFEREGGKMTTISKKPDEELWYHRIVKNFVLPRDADLSFQPAAGAGESLDLGIGPEKKKRATTTTAAPKKNDVEKAQSSKAKNVGGEKKGMRHSSDSWCDYVVVSDSLEGLAPAVIFRRPKLEPKETTDIPPSNPDDPIDLESSPEHLVRNKVGKRKQSGAEFEGQPPKKIPRKKITRRGNLGAFISESAPKKPISHVPTESLPVVNEKLPPSPPRAQVADQLKNVEVPEGGTEKVTGVEDLGANKHVSGKVVSPEIVDDAGNPRTPEAVAHDLEKERAAEEIFVTASPNPSSVMPENIKKVTLEEQGSFYGVSKNSPIRPEETLGDYYYRTNSEKDASEIHVTVWNLKKGDTFSDWCIYRDCFQGVFPPGEIKFQESRLHE
ncbi:hypothetical protein Hanom_Chr17g01565511 [Helianthus anomalus]